MKLERAILLFDLRMEGSIFIITKRPEQHIIEMKKLAVSGRGLNSYIKREVNKAYAEKLS
jgi:hypothetical protein